MGTNPFRKMVSRPIVSENRRQNITCRQRIGLMVHWYKRHSRNTLTITASSEITVPDDVPCPQHGLSWTL